MLVIEFKPDVVLAVHNFIFEHQRVLLELYLIQVEVVDLLSQVVHLRLVELLDLVVVLLQSAGLVHNLFAHVIAVLLVRVFHGDELASQHLDVLSAGLQLVQ
jgi:hypothetical protein